MFVKRFFVRLLLYSNVFRKSAELEIEVRRKLESLLPEGVRVEKASKYTESDILYKEKLKEHPPDYYIKFNEKKIAVIEVTQGKPGYTLRNSRFMKISENKLEPLEREESQGYVVMVVIAEDRNSEERFVWTTPEIIRQCYRGDKKEYVGVKWKQWLWVYRVPVNKWNIGLESLVDEVVKNARAEKI